MNEPKTRIAAFLLGMREFRLCCTWADSARTESNWYTKLDAAYDAGRDLAHKLTFRRYDD